MTKEMQQYYDEYWEQGGAGGNATPGMRRWTQQRRDLLLESLKTVSPGSLVLDAGCGAGDFSALMAENKFRPFGIDIAALPLERAFERQVKGVVGWAVASVEGELPFADETFSAIWSTEVIEHLINVQTTFNEFARVLKPGGLLILTTPYHGLAKNLLLSVWGYEKHYNPDGPHIRFYTRKSLQTLLTNSGFDLLKATGVGRFYPMFMSHFIVARKK